MELFDTHFHIQPEDNVDLLINNAHAAGVNRFMVAGATIEFTETMLERILPYPEIYAAVGVHPHQAGDFAGDLTFFEQLYTHPQVCAVGEVGLDYYYNNAPSTVQQEVFSSFLRIANDLKKPVIIHCRDAFEDTYNLVANHLKPLHPFVIHCFTSSKDWADRFIALGGYVSFNGIITFKKSENIRAVMRELPLDRILFETDSPYLAPEPYRGKRNEPAFVARVIERAALEFGKSSEEMAAISTANAIRFFNLQEQP